MTLSRTSYSSHWSGPKDQPRWWVTVTIDDDESPIYQSYDDGHGLPLLERLVEATIPSILVGADPEPHTLKIEMTEVPF